MNLPLFIMQLIIILGAARLVGWVFRKIRQPQVVGEMAAGVLLGPSLLGAVWPEAFAALFPSASLGYIDALSQLGLIIFMFLIGAELDLKVLRRRSSTALVTSPTSIVVPYGLGVMLAALLYPEFSGEDVSFLVFSMFIGTAMSITAFPVLARILSERKLLRTELGALAIACAALDDITGWMLLAVVLLIARAGESNLPIWGVLLGLALYTITMLFPMRRVVRRIAELFERRGEITQGMLALLLFSLTSAWMTESLGIHALFGAFLAGVVMPRRTGFVHAMTEKLSDVSVVLLLPLFFAYTGLRTSIGLLSGMELWILTGLIVLVAVVGKFAGATLPARATGMTWRDAAALGALMNTRGLMELVLLNIGLDIGVITPTLFTMLVVMAMVTTFITSPAVEWIYFRRLAPRGEYQPTAPDVLDAMECEEVIAVE